jgi:oxygen-independent coproporphyrinogen-3 oxidase
VGKTFTQNQRELRSWDDEVGAGRLPVFRGYIQTADDAFRGAVIEECLCAGRISKDAIEKRFGIRFDDYFTSELMRLHELERDGLIEGRTSRTLRVTPIGRVFVRAIARVFDAYQQSAIASKAV